MRIPKPVVDWLQTEGHGRITSERSAAGGCIHTALHLETESRETFFLKVNDDVPADMFLREAEGLTALALDGPRVPRPYLHGPSFLLMEDLASGNPRPDCWEDLGRSLARLHSHVGTSFGFDHDNYIGLTPQPNAPTADGHEFFAERRIRFQAERAAHVGLLEASDLRRAEAILDRLPELVPAQPPSLIHGDLWSGNVLCGPEGFACLVDPACHYGWAEAELGMTALFGGFPEAFYRSYEEARPLLPGWRSRLPIYNLYHLLNHLNLFGSGYLESVRSILRRFS